MPATEEPLLTIGQLAARAGLNTSHIRFYERVGVLPERQRPHSRAGGREAAAHRRPDRPRPGGQAVAPGRAALRLESVDVCGLFVDPTLLQPADGVDLDVRHVRRRA